MINRGRRRHVIPDGVELLIADKDDKRKIQSLLGKRTFDAVMDYLCYSNKDTESSFRFYSQYTKQYFFISSCAVYNTSLGGLCKEDAPKVLPIWSYSVNKWRSEENLMKLASNTDVNYTIIRPSITYGDTRIPYGISPEYGYHWTLVARVLSGKPLIRWNKGENRANMMRVEDFAVGVVGLIGNKEAFNEAFNVCGDETPSFNEVLSALEKIVGKKAVICDVSSEFYAQEVPERAGEILGGRSIDTINSNEKIKGVVPSFRQTILLLDGIKMTYDAYVANNYQYGIDWNFDAQCDRVVWSWCNHMHDNISNYNIGFVDYLGTATLNDRINYWIERVPWGKVRKAFRLSGRMTQKLKMIVKGTTANRGG